MRRGVYCYGRPPASPEDCLCPQTPERTEPWLNEGAQVGRGTGSRLPDGLRDIGARRRYEEVPQVEGPHGPPRGKEEHSVTALIGLRAGRPDVAERAQQLVVTDVVHMQVGKVQRCKGADQVPVLRPHALGVAFIDTAERHRR